MAAGTNNKSSGRSDNATSDDINILLLGETGIGKSTFINAFANYLIFEKLPDGDHEDFICLIPTSFTMYDHNGVERIIQSGEETPTESAPRRPACYEFSLGDRTVRIIDTPGIGDPRGIELDNINLENILNFISNYESLHCICILLKPNNTRLTVTFEYCIKQLLCHLQRDASKNIVFVYTNSRDSFYNSGDTGPILAKMLRSIESSPPYVNIKYDPSTKYCLDNESFRFLMAVNQGMTFNENTKRQFSASWDNSVKECQRLMKYIIGYPQENILPLPLHRIKDTISLNNARRMILKLSRPLALIIDNIFLILEVLQKRKREIEENSSDIENLKDKLYIPTISMKIVPLDRPHTICTAAKCCDVKVTEGVQRYIEKKVCCRECQTAGNTGDIIGHSMLWFCRAMNWDGKCKVCGCSYRTHMHKYYDVKEESTRVIDETIVTQMNAKVEDLEKIKQFLQRCQEEINEYNKEKAFITKVMAEFACFLRDNAIVRYNDAFKKYLEYRIENLETAKENGVDNQTKIKDYRQMIKDYEACITEIDKVMKSDESKKSDDSNESDGASCPEFSATYIFEKIEQLKRLELSGKTIAAMHKAQQEGLKNRYVHRVISVIVPKDNRIFNFTNRTNENPNK